MSDSDDANPHEQQRRKCDGLRYDLKMCLLKSDCVQEYHHLPKVVEARKEIKTII